jgi:hypothetical protein
MLGDFNNGKKLPICLAVVDQEPPSWNAMSRKLMCSSQKTVTVTETVAQLSTGHSDMQKIIKILGYQKMCCHWVPLLLTNEYKRACMDVSSQLLQQHAAKGDEILLNTVTDAGSWFHHFDLKTK